MKIDYNKLMHDEISSLESKPRLLLHCCCAPCSSAVIEKIKDYFDITYLYFNPNIYPLTEYQKRKEEFKKLDVSVVDIGYNHDEFLDMVKNHEQDREGGDRCRICIAYRMDRAFKYAKENNFDLVTTTLSISPHKDAQFINVTGESLSQKYEIKYLHADFKKENGYLRSTLICKDKEIYRQNYCGCEFSANQEN
ncbi:MAG TPA: epoxyqueuosine reductase QueH [Candidatus Onthoplasma faecigallinarum]|nr:epoxyqueuosine reductase QueH [Candidatus Onthoplasma faecigallinarum]